MRKPEYLSPSGLAKFYNDREQYYIDYLSDAKPGRSPQNNHMAIGSAFDAYIKSYLHEKLIGKDPRFDLETLYNAQVEPHNRDLVRSDAKFLFDKYVRDGCVADLLLDLNRCIGEPKFESEVKGIVSKGIHAIPMLGKPDINFLTKDACRCIFDWKVNGHYTQNPVSPMKGYIKLFDNGPFKQHPDAMVLVHKGISINVNETLDNLKTDWADQFSIYAWLCGEPIGADFVVAVDQVVCNNVKVPRQIRFAQHRMLVSAEYQHKLYDKAAAAWKAITTGHIFFELDRETSDLRCQTLEMRAKNMISGTQATPLFNQLINPNRER